MKRKTNWKKVDVAKYTEIVEKKANTLIHTLGEGQTPVDAALDKLNQILYQASTECAPPSGQKISARKLPWHPDLKPLAECSKLAHYAWKQAGRPPDRDHPASRRRRIAKVKFRNRQRQIIAEKRDAQLQDIMDASPRDQALFYRLIRQQRGEKSNPDSMQFSGETVTGNNLMNAWKRYFETLATPCDRPEFDDDH